MVQSVNFINLEYFYKRIYEFIASGFGFSSVPELLRVIMDYIIPVSAGLSIFLLFLIVYYVFQLLEIRKKEQSALEVIEKKIEEAPEARNEKWEEVLKHIQSENPSEWKEAILEADGMLDEMLDKMGYHGDGVGEKLKLVEVSDLTTLDSAWEAHKVRNNIAHQTSGYVITKREADRVIRLFQKVFEETRLI